MYTNYLRTPYPNELYHHGVKGMHWGKRRFQNKDGSLTPAGESRYGKPMASGRKKIYSKNTGSLKVDKKNVPMTKSGIPIQKVGVDKNYERGKHMVDGIRKKKGVQSSIQKPGDNLSNSVSSVDRRFKSKLANCGIKWDKYKDTHWYKTYGPEAVADDLGWNLITKKRTSPKEIEELVDYYYSEYDMHPTDARKIINMYLAEMKPKNNKNLKVAK